MKGKRVRVTWMLNLYKLTFGVVLFCYLSNQILEGVTVSSVTSAQEVGTGSSSSGKSKHSQSKDYSVSQSRHHHHHDVQQVDLNVTQPTVLIPYQIHSPNENEFQLVPKTTSDSGSDSSSSFKVNYSVSPEIQKAYYSGYSGSGSFKSDEHFSGMDASAQSGSGSQTETPYTTETQGLVEPGSSPGSPFMTDSSKAEPSPSSNSSEVSTSPTSGSPLISTIISYIYWLYNLIKKLFS